jgi:hypothetical protein
MKGTRLEPPTELTAERAENAEVGAFQTRVLGDL